MLHSHLKGFHIFDFILTMKVFYLLFFSFLIFSCQKKSENFSSISESKMATHEGKALMATHCYLCHNPNAPADEGRIGPPMIAIKAYYFEKYPTKDTFIAAVKNFTENPQPENVLLLEDYKKYGLMPKQVFPEGTVEQIADFMYEYKIEAPDWFEKAHQAIHPNWQQSGKIYEDVLVEKSYADIGLDYALETKKVLGKNLMGTIQNKGVLEALTFCNHRALPLTDSLAQHFNATIKRVSDKNRNPQNKANEEEIKYIKIFKNKMLTNQEIKPIAVESKNRVSVYYPIETNSMCLKCHGKNIEPEVSRQILKLYPQDLAVGYEENELRGIWHIAFEKSKIN